MSKSQVKPRKSPFTQAVEAAVQAIPRGRVASYGQIALLVGMPRAAQAVGQTLHYIGEYAPWHRVLNRHGRLVTKCGHHTLMEQEDLLRAEGVEVHEQPDGNLYVNMERFRWLNTDADLERFLVQGRERLNRYIELR